RAQGYPRTAGSWLAFVVRYRGIDSHGRVSHPGRPGGGFRFLSLSGLRLTSGSMLKRIRLLLEMIRFSHTLFALPFALLSAALAWREKNEFSWIELVGILACMVFARSAAMAFNRLADRKIDAANPRTAQRHLPAGQLSMANVALFALICGAGFIGSTFIFLLRDNAWPALLAVPVLGFILLYSYTKRFTV